MQAFLGRVAERSDAVLDSSQRTYASARISAIALLSTALLLAALCWAFIRRGVLLPLREAGMHFDRIAGGDLTSRVETRSNNEIGALFAALKRMQEGLTRTVSTVRQGVDEINIGSAEIAAGNANLSSRTEEQAAALEQTAATMEQLAATVKQNADNAAQANQLAAVSMEVAQRGGQTVGQVVQTMQGISDSSKRIADIVSVIDGIAFQTNILALNAAVEAARAGEQGKGFAVVAGEVRTLAQRAAQAAKEIKTLIETSVDTVASGSAHVTAAGQTMQEIVTSVQRVADIMGEISAASAEQAGGIDQITLAVSQMDEVTQQNAALVEEASAAASAMEDQARKLAEATAVFKTQSGQVIEAEPAAVLAHGAGRRACRALSQAGLIGPGAPRPARRALFPATQQGVQDDGAERGGADPAQREITQLDGEITRAQHQRDRGHDQVAVIAEIDLVHHPDTGAGHGDQAKHHDRHAAQHGRRDGLDQGAELGREAQHDGDQGRHHEDQGGIDAGHGHHADVLGIGGDAGAADRAGHHGGHAVTDERAAQVAVQVLARHGADRLDVAQVLGNQNDGDRHDQAHGLGLEHRRREMRQAEPGRRRHAREVHGLAQAQDIGADHVHHAGQDQAHQDQQPLHHAARVHGDAAHAQDGDEGHGGVEARLPHRALGRDGRQVQADHGHHGTGHHRRHQRVDPARPPPARALTAQTIRPIRV